MENLSYSLVRVLHAGQRKRKPFVGNSFGSKAVNLHHGERRGRDIWMDAVSPYLCLDRFSLTSLQAIDWPLWGMIRYPKGLASPPMLYALFVKFPTYRGFL